MVKPCLERQHYPDTEITVPTCPQKSPPFLAYKLRVEKALRLHPPRIPARSTLTCISSGRMPSMAISINRLAASVVVERLVDSLTSTVGLEPPLTTGGKLAQRALKQE